MLILVLKRILLGLITLFIVSLITFVGVEVLPGDACTTYLEWEAYGAALEACYKRLGLDIPAYERYVSWAIGVIQGDFGYSLSGEMKINDVLNKYFFPLHNYLFPLTTRPPPRKTDPLCPVGMSAGLLIPGVQPYCPQEIHVARNKQYL